METTRGDDSIPFSAGQRAAFEGALELLAHKIAEDEKAIGIEFPHVTAPDGKWKTYPASWSAGYSGDVWSHGHWTCGYWVGLLLAAHLHTREERFLVWARERMRLVEQRAEDPNTHDIGFIFDGSAIPGYHVTKDGWYAGIALSAANRLRARLVTTQNGAYLAAWGPLDDSRARSSSAIDTMGNLSLLYWAAHYSGDASFRLVAEAHARKTRDAFVRADDSTYHAVEYDPKTGWRLRGYTFQGYSDESTWPRGQAWAIYGCVNTARETGMQEWIELAERLVRYWLRRLGDATVPPWDFDDPAAPRTLKDSASSAIVAAALVELATIHPDRAAGRAWGERAVALLEGLCRDYLATDPQHRGLLMHGCYSKPHNDGIDSATMFGDFYFVEALCKLVLPGALRPVAAPLVS